MCRMNREERCLPTRLGLLQLLGVLGFPAVLVLPEVLVLPGALVLLAVPGVLAALPRRP
jgi:hypothetical protein